jgi:flavodoxin I
MSKILIVYGSTTGNTEMVAEQIMDSLKNHEVSLQDAADTSPEDLTKYDVLVLGSSTWDDGLLQQDFRDFVEGLEIDLTDKKLAIFGLGDSNYPDFCEAADILEKIFTKLGGETIVATLKIDGFPDEEENEQKIEAWCQALSQKI